MKLWLVLEFFFRKVAMEAAVRPLQSSAVFGKIILAMSNPILGVLAGAIITAAIQASAASVGMLQALASTGLLPFSTAFSIIMGQNIGTCITPILSSIGASKNAKRSALIHLYVILSVHCFLFGRLHRMGLLGKRVFGQDPQKNIHANFTFFNIAGTFVYSFSWAPGKAGQNQHQRPERKQGR
jgi:phosphate:Na+ symporter